MRNSAKFQSAIVAVILAIGLTAWGVARAQVEASALVEKQQPEAAVDGPVLPTPTNEPSLPPPAKPEAARAAEKPTDPAIKKPFMRPAAPRRVPANTALQLVEEPMPAPYEIVPAEPAADIEVRPAPPIEYDTDRDARRMYRGSGEINLVMVTQNPADHCFYEIPLCIPACCTDEPSVSSGRGILGRGVVEYCWSCGFRAIVKFRHVLGDVKVEYEGD